MPDKKLLEIIVCPKCKTKLKYDEALCALICNFCKIKYPIKDDVPFVIEEEAEILGR